MAQPLFGNQREANLASIVTLVESVLGELYHAQPPRRVDAVEPVLHAWCVEQGSATATIALVERPEFTHLRISSIVMTLDTNVDRTKLYAHLLELNGSLCGNAFALDRNDVLLVAERSTLDLDRSELVDLVRRVMTNADRYHVLVGKLGG